MNLRFLWGLPGILFCGTVSARQPADDGEWRTRVKDPGLTRSSSLAQIDSSNAAQLKLAPRTQEHAP